MHPLLADEQNAQLSEKVRGFQDFLDFDVQPHSPSRVPFVVVLTLLLDGSHTIHLSAKWHPRCAPFRQETRRYQRLSRGWLSSKGGCLGGMRDCRVAGEGKSERGADVWKQSVPAECIAAMETTQEQIDGFFSQLPFKYHLPEVASVGV